MLVRSRAASFLLISMKTREVTVFKFDIMAGVKTSLVYLCIWWILHFSVWFSLFHMQIIFISMFWCSFFGCKLKFRLRKANSRQVGIHQYLVPEDLTVASVTWIFRVVELVLAAVLDLDWVAIVLILSLLSPKVCTNYNQHIFLFSLSLRSSFAYQIQLGRRKE